MRQMAVALLVAAMSLGAAFAAGDTLYERMGGKKGMAAIASRLVDYTTTDPRIMDSFKDSNIPRLKGLLTLFFCKQAGGPCTYPGRDMVAAHAELGLRSADFNALVEDLQKAMSDEGIGFATQNEFLALFAPMHRDVVQD